MLKLKTSVFRMLLLCLAAAVVLPLESAAQTVTGSISGTVVDPQKSIVPGATVTIVSEATSDSRVAVTDDQGHFQVTNLQPGSYTARVELASFRTFERKNIVLSAGERSLDRHHRVGGGQPWRNRDGRGARLACEHRRDAECRRAHVQADRAGPGARPRCHVADAAASGRALREHGRLARHELRHGRAERRRRPPRLEQRHRRRRGRERSGRHQPDGAADQPRRDFGSARPAEFLPRRIRAGWWRTGADCQQERWHLRTAAISTTTGVTRR